MAFGIALSVRSRVRECTPALFNQVVDSPATASVCAEIEDALESVRRGEMTREDFETFKSERKKRLAILTPHAMFPNGRRVNDDAVPSGLSMYDIDHINDPRGYYKAMIADRVGELGIVLAHVTPSTEGLRLIFIIPRGMTLAEAQKWMSEQLGDENYDECVKDLARCSFVVPRNYVLYYDEEEMFSNSLNVKSLTIKHAHDGENSQSSTVNGQCSMVNGQSSMVNGQSSMVNGQSSMVNGQSSMVNGQCSMVNGQSSMVNGQCSMVNVQCFKGIPYADIIAEWWNRNGGEPERGERNVKLHKLAVNLRAICDNNRDVLMAIMPRYGLSEQEMRAIVDSACKDVPKGISKTMNEVLQELREMQGSGDVSQETSAPQCSMFNGQCSTFNVQLSKLPIGLRESLVGVPQSMHMPVLCSVLPIAAAYADQVEVEYCDGMRQRLGLMSIIRGEQASGKSVCKLAVDIWKRQFEREDALARQTEEEWKAKRKGRKANEKAPDDPKVLIRMMPVTVSCSTLLRRLKNAQGHCLYSFGEELDTLRKTNGAGSWSAKYDVYRLSFDNGEWGQDYNSDQAESGVVRVAYNWTVLGTDGALRKCFKADNIENGLSSRVLVSEMPDSSFARMPKFGQRTPDDEARINDAVTTLRACSGFVDTPRLRRAIEKWVEEKRIEAAKDIDRVKDTYRKRSAVIGFRCGVIFHLLTGARRESKECIDFALMMAEYCLNQQISAFGEALQSQYVEAKDESQRYGVNCSVFDRLPHTFTYEDLKALKRGQCGEASLRKIISRWSHDKWIEKSDKHHWCKNKM